MSTATPAPPITNRELGELIGCTHSMASRLRSGKRLPGHDVLAQIQVAFDVPWDELMAARTAGRETFGELIRTKLIERAAASR